MNELRAGLKSLLLVLCLTLAACGGGGLSADGGVSGTGISAVTGNVTAITSGSTDLGGIRVTIEGTGIATVTDDTGAFTLTGELDGPVTLVFERDDGVRAVTTVDVPSGGTLELADVTLDTERQEARPARRSLAFTATIEGVDCAGGVLVVRSRGQGSSLFDVRLDGAFVHDGDGRPVACPNLRPGDLVRVQGVLLEDESIAEADVEVLPPPPTSTPRPTQTPAATATRAPTATATRAAPDPDRTPTASIDRPGASPTATARGGDRPAPSPTATVTARPASVRTPAAGALRRP